VSPPSERVTATVEADDETFERQLEEAKKQVRDMQREIDHEMRETLRTVAQAMSLARRWFGIFARAIRATGPVLDDLTQAILNSVGILFDFLIAAANSAVAAAANPVLGAALLILSGSIALIRLGQAAAAEAEMDTVVAQLGIAADLVDALGDTIQFSFNLSGGF
jgi:hypothetical protein